MSDTEPTPRVPPAAPDDLSGGGLALWSGIVALYDLEPHEKILLAEACRLADRVDDLEAVIDEHGITVEGSTGQTRLNPAVAEIRQTRLALTRALGGIAFPDEFDRSANAISLRARRAANARWKRHGA